jgi:hypothetical protein
MQLALYCTANELRSGRRWLLRAIVKSPTEAIFAFCYYQRSQTLLTGGTRGGLCEWELPTGRCTRCVALTPRRTAREQASRACSAAIDANAVAA